MVDKRFVHTKPLLGFWKVLGWTVSVLGAFVLGLLLAPWWWPEGVDAVCQIYTKQLVCITREGAGLIWRIAPTGTLL